MAVVTISTNTVQFPNGSSAVVITTATSNGATPPVYTGLAAATTITKGPGGVLPPGYPDANAFPNATVNP